jgi:hypothetical protein
MERSRSRDMPPGKTSSRPVRRMSASSRSFSRSSRAANRPSRSARSRSSLRKPARDRSSSAVLSAMCWSCFARASTSEALARSAAAFSVSNRLIDFSARSGWRKLWRGRREASADRAGSCGLSKPRSARGKDRLPASCDVPTFPVKTKNQLRAILAGDTCGSIQPPSRTRNFAPGFVLAGIGDRPPPPWTIRPIRRRFRYPCARSHGLPNTWHTHINQRNITYLQHLSKADHQSCALEVRNGSAPADIARSAAWRFATPCANFCAGSACIRHLFPATSDPW